MKIIRFQQYHNDNNLMNNTKIEIKDENMLFFNNVLNKLNLEEKITIIDAERVAIYGGIPIKEILNSSSIYCIDTNWVVYKTNKYNSLDPFVPLGYDIKRVFENKNKTVVFYRK